MKHIKNTIFLCFLFMSINSFANRTCDRTGAITICGKGTLDHLHVAGKATLEGTTVLGKTEIAGMLKAKGSSFNNLKVSGKVLIDNSQIKGKTKVSGLLDAINSKFYQLLNISSDKTYLSETYTRDIQISRGGDTQVLCVQNNTVVDGNIRFISNHGVVVIDQSSKIKGRVTGGYISKNEFPTYCRGEVVND
jgi:hypothetical protein